ncbi:MAG: hypothetical protein AAB668_01470 [Patescibacteria group bacterium]
MADEPQAVPGSEEGAKERQKKSKTSKPKFGQILDLGGQYWTIQSSDNGKVTVSRRVGDTVDTRTINEKEYESAAARPLPRNLGSSKPPKGLSVGSYIDAGRVSGYDATTGDLLVESSRGSSWISSKQMSGSSSPLYKDDSDAKGGPSGPTRIRTRGSQGDESGEKENLVDRKVRENFSDLTYGLVGKNKKTKGTVPTPVSAPATPSHAPSPIEEVETEASQEPTEVFEDTAQEASQSAAPSVKVSTTVPVGQAPNEPSIRETRVQLKTQVERAKSTPSPTGIKATVSVPTASATPVAAALGVAGAALGAMTAGTVQASPAAAIEQQALYAKAMHALDVVSTRATEKRGSIRDLQAQADGLRREVSGLNAQAAAPATGGAYRAPDVSGRIQQVSMQLGNTQNKLAMARYGLQTDEAQAQQLRIATNMMRNLAPEVHRGQIPKSIVGLVAQSIPPDVPDPSPQRAAALLATLLPTPDSRLPTPSAAVESTEAPSATPPPRSYATTVPAATERLAPASTTGLPDSVRARLSRGALTLPQATAVAFSAGQQVDRAAGGYQEGVGSPDAREAAFATEGAGANPVIDTIPQSYAEAEAPDVSEDLFSSGGEGASANFMRQQRELSAAQERFQPGATGSPEGATFIPEKERAQRVRAGEAEPDEDALRAAKLQANMARTRAAALQAFDVDEEEEAKLNLSRTQKLFKQGEAAKRNVSRLIDLFDTAHGLVDVVGIFAAIANMNMRVLTSTFRKGSLTRRFFPPAQFPIEVAGIVAMDIILFTVLFVSFCIAIAPFIIFWTAVGTGIGGLVYLLS